MCLNATPWLVVMFFRFVTSGEIRKRSEFFEPFILGLTNSSVLQVCVQILSCLLHFFSIWDLEAQIFLCVLCQLYLTVLFPLKYS